MVARYLIGLSKLRGMSVPDPRSVGRPEDPILVAGGGGFIGSHLVSALLADGHSNVRAVDKRPMDDWYQAEMAVPFLASLATISLLVPPRHFFSLVYCMYRISPFQCW